MDNDGKRNRALLSLLMLTAVFVCSLYYVAFKNGGDAPPHADLLYYTSLVSAEPQIADSFDNPEDFIAAVGPAPRFQFYCTPFRRACSTVALASLVLIFYRKWLNYGAMSVSLLHNLLLLRKIFKRAGPAWIFL